METDGGYAVAHRLHFVMHAVPLSCLVQICFYSFEMQRRCTESLHRQQTRRARQGLLSLWDDEFLEAL